MGFFGGLLGVGRLRRPQASSLRGALGLWALVALACEVSSPPAQWDASPTPPAAPSAQGPTAEPALADPGPPPEPPWPTAAGLAYREVVLATADPEQPLPMIVAIHGLGDGPDNFQHLLDGFAEPVRVILPRGLDTVPEGGWSWFPIRARDPDVEALATGIRGAADRIASGVAALQQSRPTVGKPIIMGFSQGGMLTFALAVHHPEVVGHAVAVAGWLPPPLWPTAPGKAVRYPPLLALHGTADVAMPFPPTQQAVQALVALGIAAELVSYEGAGHMIPDLMRRDLHARLTDAVQQAHRSSP
jgi:phospholipase/carboxylesterase